MSAAEWVSAIGTTAAAVAAVGIAVFENSAQKKAAAGAQRERATLIAVTKVSMSRVIIRNLGQTPVTRLRLERVTAMMEEDGGDDAPWVYVGDAYPGAISSPPVAALLPPGKSAEFRLLDWASSYGEKRVPPYVRIATPEVWFRYRDAAGTRWERHDHDLPVYVGGTPLVGISPRRWIKKRTLSLGWRVHRLMRNTRKWVRGEGFTSASQARKRRERSAQRRAERREQG